MGEIAITIKPTLSCNMKCKHCFNGEKLNHSNMIEVERVILLLEKASNEYETIKVTFHGGEPTLAGIDFYRKIFYAQKELNERKGIIFRNFFTTNGLLLNDEFVDLLIENNVLMNVSFDGPYNAVLRQNSDTVLKNIKMIQSKKGRIRCFCTLAKESFSHLQEIYDWFNKNQLDFKTLPIEKAGYAKTSDDLIMPPTELAAVFVDVYSRWVQDKECKVRYFTFEEFSALRKDMQFKSYWFNRKLALNPDGNIYPFGRPNDVNYCLGNPESINCIEDCFQTCQYSKLKEILSGFYKNKCQKCESLGVCNGVAICMTYMYEDDEKILDYSCNQSSLIFKGILAVNDKIIEDFKRGEIEGYTDFIKERFKEYIR